MPPGRLVVVPVPVNHMRCAGIPPSRAAARAAGAGRRAPGGPDRLPREGDAAGVGLAAVVADQVPGVAVQGRHHGERLVPAHRNPGGEGVGQCEARPGDRGRCRPAGGPPGGRVDQVRAALVRAGGGHRGRGLDHAGQRVRPPWVPDAHPPAFPVPRCPEHRHVPAAVDKRTGQPRAAQLVQGPLRGPALDQASGVESARHRPRVEPAAGRLLGSLARAQHLGELRRHLAEGGLAAAEPAHRAGRVPGAEHRIALVQDPAGGSDRGPHLRRRQRTVHRGDGENGSHHRLGVRGQRRRSRCHLACSLSRADWIDCAYATLVYVAPLTPWIRTLWAASTSALSMGMTCRASCCEYCSAVRSSGTETAVIWLPRTVTVTDNSPYPYCSTAPVAVRAGPAAPPCPAAGPAVRAGPGAVPDGAGVAPVPAGVSGPSAAGVAVPTLWKPSTPANPATAPVTMYQPARFMGGPSLRHGAFVPLRSRRLRPLWL